jgi:hypothetical protein
LSESLILSDMGTETGGCYVFAPRLFSEFVLHASSCIGRLYDDIIFTSRQLLVVCLGRKFSNYPSVPPYADELTCDGLMAKVSRRWPGSNGKGRR